ncbi:ATP-dependent DNA ligase [Streptacidiphilus sp. N1-10]|uniref:DNA ligase (ATP) n=1 Tax=Streptacidiphilus jeojiensis TaxID=3229225 RepID=A0ABV6XR39_9ACTN
MSGAAAAGWIAPMLAGEGPVPADTSGWAAEVKWDGMRVVVSVDERGTVRAFARSGADATARYPELQSLGRLAAVAPLVLDAEAVALDPATGVPSFERLQQRMTLRQQDRIAAARLRTPVTFMAFDVLRHRGTAVTRRGYLERRALLERLDLPADGSVVAPPAWIGADVAIGIEWTRERGMEGVILKRLASGYQPGRRSPDWIKVKFRPTADVLIGGWLADERGEPRSLLVGREVSGGLRYVGSVGSGLSAVQRELLLPLLTEAAAAESPFTAGLDLPRLARPPADVRWVRPLLRGEVQYAEVTDGGSLRQPAWKGLRGLAGE